MTKGMKSALDKYNTDDDTRFYIVEAWDAVQEDLQCCGVDGYQDWAKSTGWNNQNDVPDSCCKNQTVGCGEGTIVDNPTWSNTWMIHTGGCKMIEEN